MNKTHLIIKPDGTDLASRFSARNLRYQVQQEAANNIVNIDLTNVISISESYADELFAVLVEENGLEWFSNRIKISFSQNSGHISRVIATAIRRRLSEQTSSSIKASVQQLISTKKSTPNQVNFV
ncbi:STAS-like domain-containing protein [Methylocucumis oryzae]|uniref:STAS-like domain-containing protein n=1 Tax=Methylocucumis oryzae TaxID=1632867 RepID=UPI0006971C91|nr:DUF4325 domain-containing protein [Methylocucumis oryzae]